MRVFSPVFLKCFSLKPILKLSADIMISVLVLEKKKWYHAISNNYKKLLSGCLEKHDVDYFPFGTKGHFPSFTIIICGSFFIISVVDFLLTVYCM